MRTKSLSRRIAHVGLVSVSPLALAAGLFAGSTAPAAAACTLPGPTISTWSLLANGVWNNNGAWNPTGFPNSATTDVCITDGSSTVTQNVTVNIQNLQVGFGNGLTIDGNNQLILNGSTLSNAGTLTLGDSTGYGWLQVQNNTALSGGGTVTLTSAYLRGNNTTLTNVDNAIQGYGQVGDSGALAINNQATVNANVNGQTLELHDGLTNTGTLEATSGGVLRLDSTVANANGTILASGANSAVTLNGASVSGGTLTTQNSGAISSIGNASLTNVTISAGSTITTDGNNQTNVSGSIVNKGTLVLGDSSGYGILQAQADTTLSGGGTVTIGGGYLRGSGTTLTNQDNLIQGYGEIGDSGALAFNNQATVNANVTGKTLELNTASGGVNNTGTLEATNGGTLTLHNAITNTGASILADGSNSTVNLAGASVTNGTLTTKNGGAMYSSGDTTLTNLTISGGSTVTTDGNNQTNVNGSIVNKGTLAFGDASGYGILQAQTDTTLSGAGTVTMGYGFLRGSGTTLTNQDNLIQGYGEIGDSGALAFNNQATVNANVTGKTLELNTASGGVNSTGTLEATNGGTLTLHNAITNTGASILADGSNSTVNLAGASVTGGTLTTQNGAAMNAYGSTTLTNLTISGGSTVTTDGNNQTNVNGSIVNKGTLALGDTSGYGILQAQTDTTLSGAGTVTMGYGFLRGSGTTLTNQDNLIQGYGEIGDSGALAFNNQATVNANVTGKTLELNTASGGVNNTGTLEATNGGTLTLHNAITNTGASILADGSNSTVNLAGASVTGGTLTTQNSGAMNAYGSTTLTNLTISVGSTVTTDGNNTTYFNGSIVNKGTLAFGDGSGYGILQVSTDTTLSGGGAVQLKDGSFIRGSGTTLTNQDNSIQGTGTIGDSGVLAIVNGPGGTIASVGGALAINAAGGAFTNEGTVTVAQGTSMTVIADGAGFNQTQGASGSPLTQVDGTLDVPNGFSLQAGVLKGTGTVVGNVNNTGGAVAPGDSPGILTIQGDYTQGTGGAFDELLAGLAVGTGYSQLDVVSPGGAASLAGALDVTTGSGFALSLGDTFTIMQFVDSSGNFGSFALNGGSCSASLTDVWNCVTRTADVQFTEVFGSTFLDLQVTAYTPTTVPEPSTWAMLGLGFAGLGFLGYRSRKAAATA